MKRVCVDVFCVSIYAYVCNNLPATLTFRPPRHVCMTTSMYCFYVGFDYTYIDVNALAQGIKSFLASQVWFEAVAGARIYGTDSPAITSQPH